MAKIKAGTVRVKESFTHRKQYECAAWYKDVAILEGSESEVTLVTEGTGVRWVCFGFDGTVEKAFFPALFGGVAIPGTGKARAEKDAKEVGKPDRVTYQMYDFSVAGAIVKDAGKFEFNLDPNVVRIKPHDYTSKDYRGGELVEVEKRMYMLKLTGGEK